MVILIFAKRYDPNTIFGRGRDGIGFLRQRLKGKITIYVESLVLGMKFELGSRVGDN